MFDFFRKKILVATVNPDITVHNTFYGARVDSFEKEATVYLYQRGSTRSYEMKFDTYSDIFQNFFQKVEKNYKNADLEKWVETGNFEFVHHIKGFRVL